MGWLLTHDTARLVFLSAYALVLGIVCIYGLHRYCLVHLFYKYRCNTPRLRACFRELPLVTIQLPMFNESAVARRLIGKVSSQMG